MKGRWGLSGLLLIVGPFFGCASSEKATVVGYSAVDSCRTAGYVKDDELDGIRRRAAKRGGNAVVVVGASSEGSDSAAYVPSWATVEPIGRDRMIGDVYQCPGGPVEKVWTKRGASEQQLQQDHYDCVRDSRPSAFAGSGDLGVLGMAREHNSLYKMCMRVRGWELEPKQ